jgi:hypothetical protein
MNIIKNELNILKRIFVNLSDDFSMGVSISVKLFLNRYFINFINFIKFKSFHHH